jgi:hypothetical protein
MLDLNREGLVHFNRGVAVGLLVATAIAALGASAPSAPARPAFTTFASCKSSKPFARARHCHFRRSRPARATFVFRSNVGKRALKVCQKIYGLSFHGRQCVEARKPTAYDAIPFVLKGATKGFTVVVTFYTKQAGSSRPYVQVARVAVSISP